MPRAPQRRGLPLGGLPPDQEPHQQPAVVDITGQGQQLAGALLGRRPRRRIGLGRGAVLGLGDPEVEHLGVALSGDEDVGRLQVPVDHAALVDEVDRAADLDDQLEALAHAELVDVAVGIERRPLDVLHDEVGRAHRRRRHARVEQVRDVRVLAELAQRGHLPQERLVRPALRTPQPRQRRGHDLERAALMKGPLERLVLAHHLPHAAHAPAADLAPDRPGPELVAGLERDGGLGDLEQVELAALPRPLRVRVGLEQAHELRAQLRGGVLHLPEHALRAHLRLRGDEDPLEALVEVAQLVGRGGHGREAVAREEVARGRRA